MMTWLESICLIVVHNADNVAYAATLLAISHQKLVLQRDFISGA